MATFLEYLLLSMTRLRCAGLVVLGLAVLPLAGPVLAAPALQPVMLAEAKPQVHKVTTASEKKTSAKARPAAKPKPVTAKKQSTKASKSASRKKADAIAAPLPKARLDLSLPPAMASEMKPVEQIEAEVRKPLLPAMFGERPQTDSPFQLNGRLLSNEMQLQLRNDMRQQEIEGAAIDFEFKQ